MPTKINTQITAGTYSTAGQYGAGNGGRKNVILSNGWIVTTAVNTTNYQTLNYYVTKDHYATAPTLLATWNDGGEFTDWSIVAVGTKIYTLRLNNMSRVVEIKGFEATTVTSGASFPISQEIAGGSSLFLNSTVINSLASCQGALVYNKKDNSLHAVWNAQFNFTTPISIINARNIGYVRSKIQPNGELVAEQYEIVTNFVSTSHHADYPTLAIVGSGVGEPAIAFTMPNGQLAPGTMNVTSGNASVTYMRRNTNHSLAGVRIHSSWSFILLYTINSSYVQQLTNIITDKAGNINVVWSGTDGTNVTYNLRFVRSTNGGTSFSAMTMLTTGSSYAQNSPVLSYDYLNNLYVTFVGVTATSGGQNRIRQMMWNGTVWGAVTDLTTNTSSSSGMSYPSVIDNFEAYTVPLVTWRDSISASVRFSGTWNYFTTSVAEGHIGQKSNKSSVLNTIIYSVDGGTLPTVTEKVNGVTNNTYTGVSSGLSFIVSMNQTNWDTVDYGRYDNGSGTINTITLEVGGFVFTYTFTKTLATTDDMDAVLRSVQDMQIDYIPSVKKELVDALRSRGGSGNYTDSFEQIISAIYASKSANKRFAKGTIQQPSNNGTISVSGLPFKPELILITDANYGAIFYIEESALWWGVGNGAGFVPLYAIPSTLNQTTSVTATTSPLQNGNFGEVGSFVRYGAFALQRGYNTASVIPTKWFACGEE